MQFAGQRTDMDLKPIGEPVNLLVKMADDTLPSPGAILVTKITPQATQMDGLSEAELCRYLMDEIFTPGTCAVGYNSVRFDDEFTRHLFWRNFYDPYEWQWSEGRSRWDLLDVVRLTRALRPEGIEWPVTEDGRSTNRLELITKLNGIEHKHAHDALSDVEALISVTGLIREKQPRLYEYLFEMRDKKRVQALVNLEDKKPFVYASGRYPAEFEKTTVAFPVAPGRNGKVLVYDLRYNLDELLALEQKEGRELEQALGELEEKISCRLRLKDGKFSFFPIVKELAYNKCPAVAPLGVLEAEGGWEKIGLTKEKVEENLKSLLRHPEFAERMRTENEGRPEWPAAVDAESALYDGFLSDNDRIKCAAVRAADATKLADFHPDFADERLPGLLLHYKAKNFPAALSEAEQAAWEEYRKGRLERQAEDFVKQMEELSKLSAEGKSTPRGLEIDPFILEELSLWYQSLQPSDYN